MSLLHGDIRLGTFGKSHCVNASRQARTKSSQNSGERTYRSVVQVDQTKAAASVWRGKLTEDVVAARVLCVHQRPIERCTAELRSCA